MSLPVAVELPVKEFARNPHSGSRLWICHSVFQIFQPPTASVLNVYEGEGGVSESEEHGHHSSFEYLRCRLLS